MRNRSYLKSWSYSQSFFVLAFFFVIASYLCGPYADSPGHILNAKINLDLLLGKSSEANEFDLILSKEYSYTLLYVSILPLWIVSKVMNLNFDPNSGFSVFYRNLFVSAIGLFLIFVTTQAVKRLIKPNVFRLSPFAILFFPTFMGHIWFNEKDVPIAAGFALLIFAVFEILKLTNPVTQFNIFFLYLLIVIFSLGVRPALGIVLVPFAASFSVLLLWRKEYRKLIIQFAGMNTGILIVYLSNKAFQSEGFHWVINSVKVSSSYPWMGAVEVWSQFYRSPSIPGSYLFQVLISQIPLTLLVLCSLNFGKLFRPHLNTNVQMNVRISFILLGIVVLVTLMMYFASPIIYDDGRQLLFIWVFALLAFLLLIDSTIRGWKDKKVSSYAPSRFLILAFTFMILFDSARLFPYNYTYRNEVAGLSGAKFETDYWGISGKELTQWINRDAEKTKPRNESRFDIAYIFDRSFEPYIDRERFEVKPTQDLSVDYYAQIMRPALLPDFSAQCPIAHEIARKTLFGPKLIMSYVRKC